MSEEEEKKFPPNFPPEGPPDPLSLMRDMIQKIERAEKTIEATAKGIDAVGKLDADTLVEEGVPDPKELLFGGRKTGKTPKTTEDRVDKSLRYLDKAIATRDPDALEMAIRYNPCGICKKRLKAIKESQERIIEKLRANRELISRASRIYQKKKDHPEKSMEDIKREVEEEYFEG